MKSWLRVVAVMTILGLAAAYRSGAGTSDVHQLSATIRGVTQWSSITNPVIQKVQLTSDDLVNLGLGQPLGTPVLKNQQLGLVSSCGSNDYRIIVYDTSTESNLATIGNMPAVSVITQIHHHQHTRNVVSELVFNFGPSATNGLGGGVLFAAGNVSLTTNDCLNHYTAKLIGAMGASFFFTNVVFTNVVDLTVTNLTTNTFFVVSNFPVNVSSTVITSGRKLGSLVEP